MFYRKEIDGLRALAVLPVIFFHAGFSHFAGGYVGVDIFFVISGYLITSIILSDLSESRFSLSNFYERRARRILPPLYAVMFISSIFVFLNYSPYEAKDFYQSLVAATLFLSNYFFYIETDYFNDFSESAPLLHTWSLAVEEQYYLLFPVLLIFLSRFKKLITIICVVFLFIASLSFSFFESSYDQGANFYLLPSRLWELLVGAIIAIALIGNQSYYFQDKTSANILSFLGIALIFFAIATFDKETIFPGINALFPTIGTALLIVFLNDQTILYKFFSFKPMVKIGLLSYSLYLWHQPIFAISRSYSLDPLSTLHYLLLIILAFIMSVLSYKYIEIPYRNKRIISTNMLIKTLVLFILFFLSLGFAGHKYDGFKDSIHARYAHNENAIYIDKNFELSKRTAIWNEQLLDSDMPYEAPTKKRILIIGDSKSEDLFIAMKLNNQFDRDYEIRRMELNDSCMQSRRSNRAMTPECTQKMNTLKNYISDNNPNFIIFSNTWTEKYNQDVSHFILEFAESYKTIVFSTANFNDMTDISLEISRKKIINSKHFVFKNIHKNHQKASDDLRYLLSNSSVQFIEKLEFFCSFDLKECNILDSKPLIYDSGHLTDHGAIFLGQKLYPPIFLGSLD